MIYDDMKGKDRKEERKGWREKGRKEGRKEGRKGGRKVDYKTCSSITPTDKGVVAWLPFAT